MQKEWKLDQEKFQLVFLKKCQEFGIKKPNRVKFFSQQDEDKYIIQYLLNKKIEDGVYLEAGACDGKVNSNTKTLEDYFGFKGILIEPQKHYYDRLVLNRKNNELYNCAISDRDVEEIEFLGETGSGGVKDTLTVKFDTPSYMVKVKKLSDILEKSKYTYIDFMIIDVEGHELEFLRSINFSFPIFCIIIEAASDQKEKNKKFGDYLTEKGFTLKERQRGNEIWLNKKYFRKDLFVYE